MAQANQKAQEESKRKMIKMDVSDEEWREYSWIDPVKKERVTYRIEGVKEVYFYNGCTTHRVVDKEGVAHCVPAIGYHGCVLRWKSKKGLPPVAW